MEFRDVGCVRISFAINYNHGQPILIENLHVANSTGGDSKSSAKVGRDLKKQEMLRSFNRYEKSRNAKVGCGG